MAIGLSSIFTPGFTTSKPGDMKNSSGMMDMNMYAGIAAKNPRSMADIKAEPRTEFDLDLNLTVKGKAKLKPGAAWEDFAMPRVTVKDFEREYMTKFDDSMIDAATAMINGSKASTTASTNGAQTFSLESIEQMKREIGRRVPTVNRDTPESAPSDAW